MTTWNYRVFREADGGLSIREAFYAEDGQVIACGEPATVEAVSIHELTALLNDWRRALDLPVLALSDIPARPAGQSRTPSEKRLTQAEVLSRLGLTVRSS